MHGVKRLFSWMIPRFDAARFNVSLLSLRKRDLSEERSRPSASTSPTSNGRNSIEDASGAARAMDAKQPDVLHMHGYGATTFGRLAAACGGSRRSCTSTRT